MVGARVRRGRGGEVRARPTPVATIGTSWDRLLGAPPWDEVLGWPPDLFVLTDRVLDASEAYRFIVSHPPDSEWHGWADHAPAIARDWWEWLDEERGSMPEVLATCWETLLDHRDVPIRRLADGMPWELCEALLALHAVADEACAGLGTATAVPPGAGCRFRARARELLADTGSLSRVSTDELRVLPRCRATTTGMSLRSLARHVGVAGPQVDVDWHRSLARPSQPAEARARVLLLPWPLEVHDADFRPLDLTLPNMDTSEFGFFEYCPSDRFDVALVDATLAAAERDVGPIDVVILPETAILPHHVEPLEQVLARHGVWCLITGVREPAEGPDGLGANWVHLGVRQDVVWRRTRQDKHHRWCLDGPQIRQYHLEGALDPAIRWWEAVSLPPRSLQVVDLGAGVTIAPLICEDLARQERVTDLLRSIAPSVVVTVLLDGPQLGSRWTSRYAGVLADDPGCAVCTLTAYGMVRRSCPPGHAPSKAVALWKDPDGGLCEVPLEEGAHGVVLTCEVTFKSSRTADGRLHAGTSTSFRLTDVAQVRADLGGAAQVQVRSSSRVGLPPLQEDEVTKATSWTEALAEAAAAGSDRVQVVLDDALDGCWRADLGVSPPTRLFEASVAVLERALEAATDGHREAVTPEVLMAAALRLRASAEDATRVTGELVALAVEQRSRRATG